MNRPAPRPNTHQQSPRSVALLERPRRAARRDVLLWAAAWVCASAGGTAAEWTPLLPARAPRIVAAAEAYPGSNYAPGHLVDGRTDTEYSSNGKGTGTFVELAFPSSVKVGAFRHVDRNDPATVAGSELVFTDSSGQQSGVLAIRHVNTRGGETFYVFPSPVSAERVRWRITSLGRENLGTVGGAELEFFAVGSPESVPTRDQLLAKAVPFVEKGGGSGVQPVQFTIRHVYAESADALLHVADLEAVPVHLKPGANTVEIKLPPVKTETLTRAWLEVEGQRVTETQLSRKPVRELTVYLLPHSHTDIGYTEIQTAIEKKQVQNLVDGIAHARRTANYPEGARFVWNVEVLWAADLYLHRLSEAQRQDFFDAVRKGQVALCGMYLNELTGLCRPEELVQLFEYATELGRATGVPINSVMISDVPGYTWGTVPAMAHAGIKYFSTAPNYFDRIGTILREWENKPFWWVGPDGESKVLVWIPFWGYAMSHRYGSMSPQLVEDFYAGLEKRGYPYDIAYARWSGHGDNAVPDPTICDFVRDWNVKYLWPRFIISGVNEAFGALEKKYGTALPKVRGDWTPYWEDGAGSSAVETALNRESSDRLVQAEALFAMLNPKGFPQAAFAEAWKNVLLYSEHTWGADCSISQPESQKTREQWEIKQGYARAADAQARRLLNVGLHAAGEWAGGLEGQLEVFNTTAWPRTELVLLTPDLSRLGDQVVDESGEPLPSQRLTDGRLAFIAHDVPPLASTSVRVRPGKTQCKDAATVAGATLDNGILKVRLDERTGGIVELTARGLSGNLVDTSRGEGLNEYLYLPGDDLAGVQRNGPVTISIRDKGPLVASLMVESPAPGCRTLRREIRLTAGVDYVEIYNLVDKARLEAKSYHSKDGKESVNFAFPFQVPDGAIQMDLPLAIAAPEADQMPSACKNWLTVGRWVDVSNRQQGITWITLDAPLVQLGGLTANLLNSQTNPEIWRKHVEPTQKIYSWAMNNHWGTNYRAYQEGPTLFRYILRPHTGSDTAAASRLAIGFSQPLLAARAESTRKALAPLLQISPRTVLLSAVKPAQSGHALIVRLFNASNSPQEATITWGTRQPRAVFLSDTSEESHAPLGKPVRLAPYGLVTLRAELE